MDFISVSKNDGIATITLSRGKVNALNEIMVEQLNNCFTDLETDGETASIILTGQGKFFSFGFDIPEFLDYPKDDFVRYLTKFADLYTRMFLFPKPIVAALNGHTIAGSCMLATACDYRIMVSDSAKISLNEIGFGSSVFAGSVEMLGYCAGWRNAETILYSGGMYSADEAFGLGLIDMVSIGPNLIKDAESKARDLGQKDSIAFGSIKGLLREPVAERMISREKESIQEFVDIWYSKETWEKLKKISIKK